MVEHSPKIFAREEKVTRRCFEPPGRQDHVVKEVRGQERSTTDEM